MCKKIFYIAIIVSFMIISIKSKSISAEYDAYKPEIVEDIKNNIALKDTITYTVVPRGIILSIAQSELFLDKADVLSKQGQYLLSHIARILNSFNNQCTIEAHTEEEKFNRKYGEDWEISIVRANSIASYMVNTLGLESNRLFPIGFGNIMPFKDNVNENVDFPNNRIDFVIFDYTVSR